MITLQLLIGIVLCLWIYILWSRRKYYILSMKIPGPLGYPILGMALQLRNREKILGIFSENEKKYGSVFLSWLGPTPCAVVSDPQTTQDILTSPHCINKGVMYQAFDDGTGPGLFSLKNPVWSVHRRLLNSAFGHKVLLSFIPIFNRKSNALLQTFDTLSKEGEVDLTRILQDFTLNVAAQTTMGTNLSLVNGYEGENGLLNHYQRVQEGVAEMCVSPWLQYKVVQYFLGKYVSYNRSKVEIRNFVRKLIAEKVERVTEVKNTETQQNKNIFINRAIELLKRDDFTWKNVEDESNVIVFGAFETTANTILYTLTMLAMFPKYQEKVFEEIISLFPESGEFEISYAASEELIYMGMVLNETMRMMAPVPLVAREVSEDIQLSNGVVLPRGLQVVIDIFNMHRRTDIWGPEAHVFNPDNFLPSNLGSIHPYSFIPFTKGIRNCIGWKYGLMSIKIVLTKLLRNYRFTTKFSFHDLQFVEDVTIKLKKVPLLEIHKRVK